MKFFFRDVLLNHNVLFFLGSDNGSVDLGDHFWMFVINHQLDNLCLCFYCYSR